MDLSLFAVRQFRVVNVATLVFATAFYGMLLGNVVFLQTAWHYSVLGLRWLPPRARWS